MQTTDISFEYDAADRTYTHRHVIELEETDPFTAEDLIEQVDAQAEQMRAMIREQLQQAGIEDASVEIEPRPIDDAHIGVKHEVAAPATAATEDVLGAGAAGEATQLLLILAKVDIDRAEGVIETVDEMLGTIRTARAEQQ